MEHGWLSVLPPVAAIALAIATRQVILSLFFGVWMGWTILAGWDVVAGLEDGITALVDVFKSGYNTKVILFSALVGSLITLTQRSGGVEGFVRWMQSLHIGRTPRSAQLVAWVTGVVVFVESSITCLVVGAVSRPLCDDMKVSREKLSYICDSTSAPVCILIPLNAWGAYIMGLLVQQGVDQPLSVLLAATPLNFYALAALFGTLVIILTGWDVGPMRRAERRARTEGKLLADGATPMIATEVIAMATKPGVEPRKVNMIVPIATMILMMPLGLYVTGRDAVVEHREATTAQQAALQAELHDLEGELQHAGVAVEALTGEKAPPDGLSWTAFAAAERYAAASGELAGLPDPEAKQLDFFTIMGEGSGSTAVLWAVLAATAIAAVLYLVQRILTLGEIMDLVLKGAGGLIPMAAIMILAFAINETCNTLQTGQYVASVVEPMLSPQLLPALLFATACVIAFSTGTSWGTFGIMMPIGVPLAVATGGSLPLAVAAILGGGVFGDHCSPISDTTVISSMASASDHIDHVKTQLPYALAAAGVALVGYLIAGLLTA